VPASAAWNSAICHCRAISHNGSNRRALMLRPTSGSRQCGFKRVQLNAGWRTCRPESVDVAKNAARISGLAKRFPGGILSREQRLVRMSEETVLSLA
jgi:hypothetical protein